MKLPTVEVIEVHYWTVLIKDEIRPKGEEFCTRYETREAAEAKMNRFIKINLATRGGLHEEGTQVDQVGPEVDPSHS